MPRDLRTNTFITESFGLGSGEQYFLSSRASPPSHPSPQHPDSRFCAHSPLNLPSAVSMVFGSLVSSYCEITIDFREYCSKVSVAPACLFPWAELRLRDRALHSGFTDVRIHICASPSALKYEIRRPQYSCGFQQIQRSSGSRDSGRSRCFSSSSTWFLGLQQILRLQ